MYALVHHLKGYLLLLQRVTHQTGICSKEQNKESLQKPLSHPRVHTRNSICFSVHVLSSLMKAGLLK